MSDNGTRPGELIPLERRTNGLPPEAPEPDTGTRPATDAVITDGPLYADTTGTVGVERWYAVASVAGAETGAGPLFPSATRARPTAGPWCWYTA